MIGGIMGKSMGLGAVSGLNVLGEVGSLARGSSAQEVGGTSGGIGGISSSPFMTSLVQSLSSILPSTSSANLSVSKNTGTGGGAGATTAGTATSSAQTPEQALGAFLQALLASLYGAQQGNSGGSGVSRIVGGDSSGLASSGPSLPGAAGIRSYQGGPSSMVGQLQSLAQSLSATAGGQTSSSGATKGVAGVDALANVPGSSLQKDFTNLLAAFGATNSQATLSSFLGTLSNNLQTHGAQLGLNSVA